MSKDEEKKLFKITQVFILSNNLDGEKKGPVSLKTWGTAVELHAGCQLNF